MPIENISINPEQATAAINLLAEGHDQAATARGQLLAHGVGVGAASDFRVALTQYVFDLKATAKSIQDELQILQQGVTDTIVDLGERDAALAQQTTQFLAGIEAMDVPKPAPQTTGTTMSMG